MAERDFDLAAAFQTVLEESLLHCIRGARLPHVSSCFAGGGGIGFLLSQNIRLLDYRAASTQMIAIAIVVATMDYTSSAIRKRFV